MTKTFLKSTTDRADQAERVIADPTERAAQNVEQSCEAACPAREQPADTGDEAIRVLAYCKWEAAGCPESDGLDFWLDAEREVHAERSGSSSAEG